LSESFNTSQVVETLLFESATPIETVTVTDLFLLRLLLLSFFLLLARFMINGVFAIVSRHVSKCGLASSLFLPANTTENSSPP